MFVRGCMSTSSRSETFFLSPRLSRRTLAVGNGRVVWKRICRRANGWLRFATEAMFMCAQSGKVLHRLPVGRHVKGSCVCIRSCLLMQLSPMAYGRSYARGSCGRAKGNTNHLLSLLKGRLKNEASTLVPASLALVVRERPQPRESDSGKSERAIDAHKRASNAHEQLSYSIPRSLKFCANK
jgi:hypothetical protein